MIFGILALSLKNKTLGIIAIVSGVCFSIIWLLAGIAGGYYGMLGSLMIIAFTCLPDLIMGIISVTKHKNKDNVQTFNQSISKKESSTLTEKLLELNSLKEKGLLTEEEYLETKSNILSKWYWLFMWYLKGILPHINYERFFYRDIFRLWEFSGFKFKTNFNHSK